MDPDAAFEAVYPALRDALVLDQEYIVLDGIEDPAGKYPKSLGNVVILEKEFVELLIAETIEGFVAANGPALTAAGVDPDSLQPLSQFFRDGRMDEGALQVALMVTDRKELYEGDAEEVKRRMIIKSDSAFADLGADYSASVLFPVVSVLQASQFVSLFLSLVRAAPRAGSGVHRHPPRSPCPQIFTGVVFLLALLGVMVIYSLMLGDVESKTCVARGRALLPLLVAAHPRPLGWPSHSDRPPPTTPPSRSYEYGMLRALGMRHRTLSSLLLTQAAFFSGPGIVIGFAAASLLNVGVVLGLGALADVTVPWLLHPAAWALGSVLGTAIPAVANIVPIQRALSRTLRDALDLYRQTTGEITVQVMRLEKLGLSPLQTASSLALVVVGFTTYYVLPLSFVFRDLTLFLSVLNAILLCMLAGLAIMAVTVQPALERVLLWSSLWGRERKLGGIVSKNLAGHRPRNRKTATMITLTVAFLIFAGSLLALQARSISETLESFIGSDVAVRANSWTLQLPQQPLEAYLERYREGAQGVPEEFAVVRDYTWVSFPLSRTPGFTSTRLTNLARFPRPRSTVYGVERNYVEAAYDQFVVITENAPRYSAADVGGSGGDTGVVQRMHDNAGSLTLPIEKGGISIPPQVATGIRLDESSTVEYGSGEDREEEEEEVEAAEEAADAGIDSIETLEGRYRNYLDCIVSESVRLYSSVDTAVPLLSDARTERVEGRSARQYLLAKAHAMASKMPGFGFSAYTPFAFGAPMLVPMAQVAEVVNRVYNTLNLDGQGQPREEEAAAAPTNGTAADNSTASTNGTAPANGTATLPVQFTSETLPKGTLLVRFRPGVTEDGRLRFVNGLRGVLRNDLITVDDAAELTESSQNAAFALNLFFFVVALVALVLCFFASWLSFAANIRDNSREFGILRALGLSVNQVLRCYLYEAGAVVGAAFILGTIVGALPAAARGGGPRTLTRCSPPLLPRPAGILVAVSLTLQFNLFVEMPFSFSFPGLMFGINAGGCVGVALLSSYLPAKPLMRAQIARVVKGTAL